MVVGEPSSGDLDSVSPALPLVLAMIPLLPLLLGWSLGWDVCVYVCVCVYVLGGTLLSLVLVIR